MTEVMRKIILVPLNVHLDILLFTELKNTEFY